MKFQMIFFNYTALCLAVKDIKVDIVRVLLEHPNIDVNERYIILNTLFIFNYISNTLFR